MAGLTTNITSNVTNDIHYSFLRNWWAWGRAGDTIQVPGLGGALEPFGEKRDEELGPLMSTRSKPVPASGTGRTTCSATT